MAVLKEALEKCLADTADLEPLRAEAAALEEELNAFRAEQERPRSPDQKAADRAKLVASLKADLDALKNCEDADIDRALAEIDRIELRLNRTY